MSSRALWRKLHYGNVAISQAQYILWNTCHENLTTRERLHRFKLITNDKYCFFSSIETLKHIFFECIALKKNLKGGALLAADWPITGRLDKRDALGDQGK